MAGTIVTATAEVNMMLPSGITERTKALILVVSPNSHGIWALICGGRYHEKRRLDAVEVHLGATQLGGQLELGDIRADGAGREIRALDGDHGARRDLGRVAAAGETAIGCGDNNVRVGDARGRRHGHRIAHAVAKIAGLLGVEQHGRGGGVGDRQRIGIARAVIGAIEYVDQSVDHGLQGIGCSAPYKR